MAKKHKILIIYIATFSFVIFILLFSVNSAFAGIGGVSLPGSTENAGVNFKITDSEYLNITLNSSEEIKLKMESIPEMLTMMIEPVSSATSTQITVSGFLPNATYYKYQDDYHNLTEFVADGSGTYSYAQDISTPHFVFIQPRKSTKFIKDDATGGDCSLIGIWDNATKTCTLSADLNETIQIDSNNITLDGNNHTITGTNTGYGVYLYQRTGVTLKNLNVKKFSSGIYLANSSNNNIINNFSILNNHTGIVVYSSADNIIADNVSNSNNYYGALFSFSDGNIFNNNITKENNYYDIFVYASSNSGCSNTITDITGSGDKPIKYYHDAAVNLSSEVFSELILCNADYSNIRNITIDGSATKQNNTLLLMQTDNSNITNINSSGNADGINISLSNNNILADNITNSNKYYGILVWSSVNNVLENNTTDLNSNPRHGGLTLSFSDMNTVMNNAISNNYYGVYLVYSNNNKIYNNNFINNSIQIYSYRSGGNVFNLSLPNGGNYWSNFDEPAEGCNDLNNDKICDSPYFFSGGEDNYPWVKQDGWKIEQPLSVKAAELAKLVINAPYLGDGETWGGKGWDSLRALYVASADIFSGYNFWNNHIDKRKIEFGAGLDCSGLIMWAYNRSFAPEKYFPQNAIRYENANGQYLHNSEIINESDLQAGDLLFMDKDNNGKADHVAMYVENNGDYDIVDAFSPQLGIISTTKTEFKTRIGFNESKHFRRVAISPQLGGSVKAGSPIDLIVTDPDGFTITPTTAIQTDDEYLREVPGELYYAEGELGPDGRPQDMVYWPKQKIGDYIIKVTPEEGISPTETYNLEFRTGEQIIMLAENTPINQIPSDGYGVAVTETGDITPFIPVAIDIKPDSSPNSINLKSKGTVPVAIFGSATFDINQINLNSITLAGAPIKSKKNGELMTSYEDMNGDGFTDVVIHIVTESLQLTLSDTKAELKGFLFDGREIKGSDSVKIVF